MVLLFTSHLRETLGSNYNKNIFILLKANVFILLCLSVCLGVFLFASLLTINVETAEPIELKILEATKLSPGKVYGCSKLQKLSYIVQREHVHRCMIFGCKNSTGNAVHFSLYISICHLADLFLDVVELDEDELGELGHQVHQQLLKYNKYIFSVKLKLKFF